MEVKKWGERKEGEKVNIEIEKIESYEERIEKYKK